MINFVPPFYLNNIFVILRDAEKILFWVVACKKSVLYKVEKYMWTCCQKISLFYFQYSNSSSRRVVEVTFLFYWFVKYSCFSKCSYGSYYLRSHDLARDHIKIWLRLLESKNIICSNSSVKDFFCLIHIYRINA